MVWSGPNAKALPLNTPVHVITACNPFGELLSDEDNKQRNQLLLNELCEFDITLKPVLGHSPSKHWQEQSFAIFGLTREQACEIGTKYDQKGIFELNNDKLLVIEACSQKVMRQRTR